MCITLQQACSLWAENSWVSALWTGECILYSDVRHISDVRHSPNWCYDFFFWLLFVFHFNPRFFLKNYYSSAYQSSLNEILLIVMNPIWAKNNTHDYSVKCLDKKKSTKFHYFIFSSHRVHISVVLSWPRRQFCQGPTFRGINLVWNT